MKTERQGWMQVLAHAKWDEELAPLLAGIDLPSDVVWLRPPECGMVMMQARAGGSGQAFHLGEATVTRCAVKLATGETGMSYLLGRNEEHARSAALLDALMQGDAKRLIQTAVVLPLSAKIAARKEAGSRKAAATKVEFFTLVRGED